MIKFGDNKFVTCDKDRCRIEIVSNIAIMIILFIGIIPWVLGLFFIKSLFVKALLFICYPIVALIVFSYKEITVIDFENNTVKRERLIYKRKIGVRYIIRNFAGFKLTYSIVEGKGRNPSTCYFKAVDEETRFEKLILLLSDDCDFRQLMKIIKRTYPQRFIEFEKPIDTEKKFSVKSLLRKFK